jgi:uncharacterized protein (AIM24 family)
MPLVMAEARGPGHVALSDNQAGEVVALPLQHGQQIWVREHRFLTATGNTPPEDTEMITSHSYATTHHW